jgi:hypothetical protein
MSEKSPEPTEVVKRTVEKERLEGREYRPPVGPLQITPAEQGSGRSDVSINHDFYLAEDEEVGPNRA